MKHRQLAFIVLLLSMSLTIFAQEKKPHFTKEEFRAKQKAYMTRKAELTKEEANKFFVLYFELQDKKKKINDNIGRIIRDTKKKSSDQTNYSELIDKMINSRLESDKLERYYVSQYRKFLSDKKIFKVLTAEMNFHRELLKSMKQEESKQQSPKKQQKNH